jgi:tetratricopeptide (TPR) repeat protein
MTLPAEPPTEQERSKQLRPAKKRWSPRKRLRVAVTLVTVVGLAAAVASVYLYRKSRPETYRPGEELSDVTRRLARDVPSEAPLPRFDDATGEAGLTGFRSFAGGRTSQLPEDMGSGVAWGDFDNDGDDDLFLVSNGGALDLKAQERAASELYENRGDGTFRKVESFPDVRIVGMAAAWGDYDSDGWLDLVVTGYNALLLFHNDRGVLSPDPSLPSLEGYWSGAAWGDFDNDRDLDLYIGGYVRYAEETDEKPSQQYGTAVPYTLNPSSYEPERNLLYRNNGDGTFTEVAEVHGVENTLGRSLSVLWHDFDDNGWLDLYVANDVSDNVLFLNREGRLEDASHASWVADYRGAMGLAAGDWDRDGDDDLFITHWIAQENALYSSLLTEMRKSASEQESAGDAGQATNTVELAFTDQAAGVGVGQIALAFIGWGSEFVDLDADGWSDLVVANGSTFETEAVPPQLKRQEPFLFWSDNGRYFHNLAPAVDALSSARVGRGLAVADYDRDGDMDLAMIRHGEGVQLLRNEMQRGNWLQIRLRSRVGPDLEPKGFGDGAKVIAQVGGAELRRSVTGASYLSQSSRTLHFGLGEAPRVDSVEVRWLGGGVDTYSALEANTVWELTEGEPEPRRLGLASAAVADDKERLVQFWTKQRAAMDAIKRQGDIPLAIELLREALGLNPVHEDSLYYLANCLASEGDMRGAMAELEELQRINPQSHRAFKQWGTLRAMSAVSAADLVAAEEDLERSLALNPEETGSLLVLGEIALMRGDDLRAQERLELACRTNPRAVGGFFLRGYVAWRQGEAADAGELLTAAREARGEEWKPAGTVAEGDVAQQMHREETPLSRFYENWDGGLEPDGAFRELHSFLKGLPGRAPVNSDQ